MKTLRILWFSNVFMGCRKETLACKTNFSQVLIRQKYPITEFFLVRIFLYLDSVKNTPYLDTFRGRLRK